MPELKDAHGIGYCNITKCCTKVCPEHITITDNAIIPLKERVVDGSYDPLELVLPCIEITRRAASMFELKPLSTDAIPAALAQGRAVSAAERTRRGGEHLPGHPPRRSSRPESAGHHDPRDHRPVREQRLAGHVARARELVARLEDEYERLYYEGIVCERRGRAHLAQGRQASGFLAYDWLKAAMGLFERANQKSPTGNDEAVLRWNACARVLMRHPELEPHEEQRESGIQSE